MEITVYCKKLDRRVQVYYYLDPNNKTNIKFSGCDEENGSCSMCAQEHLDEFFEVLKDMAESPFYKEDNL